MLKGAGRGGLKTSCKAPEWVSFCSKTEVAGAGRILWGNIHEAWQINAQGFVTLSVSSGFLETHIHRTSQINCKETHFPPELRGPLNGCGCLSCL